MSGLGELSPVRDPDAGMKDSHPRATGLHESHRTSLTRVVFSSMGRNFPTTCRQPVASALALKPSIGAPSLM